MGCAYYEWRQELKRRTAIVEKDFASSAKRASDICDKIRKAMRAECINRLEAGQCEHFNEHCKSCSEKYKPKDQPFSAGFCRCPPGDVVFRCNVPEGYPRPSRGGFCNLSGCWPFNPGTSKCPVFDRWLGTLKRASELWGNTNTRMKSSWTAEKYATAQMDDSPSAGDGLELEYKPSELALFEIDDTTGLSI